MRRRWRAECAITRQREDRRFLPAEAVLTLVQGWSPSLWCAHARIVMGMTDPRGLHDRFLRLTRGARTVSWWHSRCSSVDAFLRRPRSTSKNTADNLAGGIDAEIKACRPTSASRPPSSPPVAASRAPSGPSSPPAPRPASSSRSSPPGVRSTPTPASKPARAARPRQASPRSTPAAIPAWRPSSVQRWLRGGRSQRHGHLRSGRHRVLHHRGPRPWRVRRMHRAPVRCTSAAAAPATAPAEGTCPAP